MANGRGGKRAGAGRKPHPNTLVYGFRLTPAQYALLKMWGGSNASAGLRWLIDSAAPLVRRKKE